MLAQMQINDVAAAMLAIFGLVGGANQIISLVNQVRAKPGHPANESLDLAVQALTHRVSRVEIDLAGLMREVREAIADTNKNNERRAGDLHERINHLSTTVSQDIRILSTNVATLTGQLTPKRP